jgi:hypothetical protein
MQPPQRLGPPYGPPANLATIFAVWRDRGMPQVVERAWFERIGLSANLASRNLHALRYLRLIADDNQPTELAERLRSTEAGRFPATLAPIVRTAYARIWAVCDPTTETRGRIEDAFRSEQPAAQRARMVTCFIGLCMLADIPLRGDRPLPRARPARPSRLAATTPPAHDNAARQTPTSAGVALLLAKFPDFDPTWPDGVKEKWFDAFGRLREELLR